MCVVFVVVVVLFVFLLINFISFHSVSYIRVNFIIHCVALTAIREMLFFKTSSRKTLVIKINTMWNIFFALL